jgi:hypothetical protein
MSKIPSAIAQCGATRKSQNGSIEKKISGAHVII